MGYIKAMIRFKIIPYIRLLKNRYSVLFILLFIAIIVMNNSVLFARNDSDILSEDRLLESTDSFDDEDRDHYFDMYVSGVVLPKNHIEVRAKVSGEITDIPVVEGVRLQVGDKLYQQFLPVTQAQKRSISVSNQLNIIRVMSELEEIEKNYDKALIIEKSSKDIALLHELYEHNVLKNQKKALQVTLEQVIESLLETFMFFEQERSLFTLEQQQRYQLILQDIYGGLPNYLIGPVRYPVVESDYLIKDIKNNDWSVVELVGLANMVDVKVTEILNILRDAEPTALDLMGNPEFSSVIDEYVMHRKTLLNERQRLRIDLQTLWQKVDNKSIVIRNDVTNIDISEVDMMRAKQLRDWQSMIVDVTRDKNVANLEVKDAELSLGMSTSPWNAVVERVYVDIGEYVAIGEPIMRLRSSEGAEVEVVLPIDGTSGVSVGAEVIKNSKQIGFVDRVVSEPVLGRRIAYITVTDPGMELGSMLQGVVRVPLEPNQFLVDRSHISFSHDGIRAVIDSEIFEIKIVRDKGENVVVEVLQN